MSPNIPFEIQEEIIKRVHLVKSLICFRSVSKQWKSLIDSSEFITHHTLNYRADTHHLLVRYNVVDYDEYNYVSIVDDDSFPQHKSSLDVSPIKSQFVSVSIVGCCHGLVCLEGYGRVNNKLMIVLWNPSIRKSIGITLPDRIYPVVFGVCSKTHDPMIVGFAETRKVEVFRLSSRAWTSVPMNLQFSLVCSFSCNPVVVDGAIHWVAYYLVHDDDEDDGYYNIRAIISFDMISEEIKEVELPQRFALSENMYMSKLNESLVLLDSGTCTGSGTPDVDVWMKLKNHASTTSFTKLFTVKAPVLHKVIGFRMNGQPIMKTDEKNPGGARLKFYEPSSKEISDYEIIRDCGPLGFEMVSYTESPLLLDISDSIIQ